MSVRDSVAQFFGAISRWQTEAYGSASFSFVALKTNEGFAILQARLILSSTKLEIPLEAFETEHLKAGHYLLADAGQTPQGVVDALLSGELTTPAGPLVFVGNALGQYGGHYQDFHPDGLQTQERLPCVTLLGGSLREAIVQPHLDWEVKANPHPHESLQELMYTYRVGNLRPDVTSVEVAALNFMAVDLSTRVMGDKAVIALRMSPSLQTDKAAVGYRALSKGRVSRGMVLGSDLTWRTEEGISFGSAEIDVEPASAVQVFACYDGTAHHQGWIVDPANAQNPRRAAYEAFDAGFPALTDLLNKTSGRGNRRDVEAAVGWLLWMLGFAVAHFGDTSSLQQGPDLLATTQSGHTAVVECTTGVLKADNKLALLVDRAEAVRQRLQASNNSGLKVMPVVVTTKTRMEVRADLQQAEQLGVLVITRETLETAVGRTLVQPDADAIFREGEQAIADALSKWQSDPMLPGLGVAQT